MTVESYAGCARIRVSSHCNSDVGYLYFLLLIITCGEFADIAGSHTTRPYLGIVIDIVISHRANRSQL